MNENNTLSIIGLGLILTTALSLAGVAAYQSIVGLAAVFAARAGVIIFMAIVIEFAKLLFVGAIHMFWREIGLWKWLVVIIIAIHMAVTNIGIYSYLSSGYTLQKAPVAAIERRIENLNGSLDNYIILEQEAVGRISAMDTAYQKLVETRFTTRAERYQDENAEMRATLDVQRDEARAAIRKLEADRAKLEEEVVANAAQLGSIEHISSFVGSDPESVMKIVALFSLLLMLGLDPAAIMMVILFTFLLSKKMRVEDSFDPIGELDDEDKATVAQLKDSGYLANRRKKGTNT